MNVYFGLDIQDEADAILVKRGEAAAAVKEYFHGNNITVSSLQSDLVFEVGEITLKIIVPRQISP